MNGEITKTKGKIQVVLHDFKLSQVALSLSHRPEV